MRLIEAAAVAAVLPLLVAAKEPVRLQPSSKWVVDYADESCRLLRTFGPSDEQSVLVMEKVAPGSPLSMLVASPALRTTMGGNDFTARFLPHVQVKAISGQGATVEGKERTPAVLWSRVTFDETYGPGDKLPAGIETAIAEAKARMKSGRPGPSIDPVKARLRDVEAMTNAAKVTAIEITRKGSKTVILETGSMGTVINLLKGCARDQLKTWGVDPLVDEKIVRPVEPIDPMRWFSSKDYPERSLRELKESVIKVRALVDAEGRITKCTPITRVSAPDFPARVCEVMQRRARFRPAELADGTRVPSYYIQPITFRVQ